MRPVQDARQRAVSVKRKYGLGFLADPEGRGFRGSSHWPFDADKYAVSPIFRAAVWRAIKTRNSRGESRYNQGWIQAAFRLALRLNEERAVRRNPYWDTPHPTGNFRSLYHLRRRRKP